VKLSLALSGISLYNEIKQFNAANLKNGR
jgi:hypothetical protein